MAWQGFPFLIFCLFVSRSSVSVSLPFPPSSDSSFYCDFVAFSYSRATLPPISNRFIHFQNELVNINANFISAYGSFEVSTAGIYSFMFSFVSRPSDEVVVALKKNGATVISAKSKNSDPTSNSLLLSLKTGDVIQLEILKGLLSEGLQEDFTYTTFSGWLLQKPKSKSEFCEVSGVGRTPSSSDEPSRIPSENPSYTVPSSYLNSKNRPLSCCEVLRVHDTDPSSYNYQKEKMGYYRIILSSDQDSSLNNNNNNRIYKHCWEESYLYLFSGAKWTGWMIGPEANGVRGGIVSQSPSLCPERTESWLHYARGSFRSSSTLSVTCGQPEDYDSTLLRGRTLSSPDSIFHVHNHYYTGPLKSEGSSQRTRPEYTLRGNRDFVEASFIFPNSNRSF